jgi:hypothetical protein
MRATLEHEGKKPHFIRAAMIQDNNYTDETEIVSDLDLWARKREEYNVIKHTKVNYGYARLDAFGRIHNRVLQHVIYNEQLVEFLLSVRTADGKRLLTRAELVNVVGVIDETVIVSFKYAVMLERLQSKESCYLGLGLKGILRLRDVLFNEPNTPVSYPFLWDTAHSDYAQWVGIASNAGAGPLGRNTGEAMGVFASLDWKQKQPLISGFSLSVKISGQENTTEIIDFESSVDLTNLQRLESHLKSLKLPYWPEGVLGPLDAENIERGGCLYQEYCVSCYEVLSRSS